MTTFENQEEDPLVPKENIPKTKKNEFVLKTIFMQFLINFVLYYIKDKNMLLKCRVINVIVKVY